MNIEKIKQVLEGAPEDYYSVITDVYGHDFDYCHEDDIRHLDDLRTILAQHEEIERVRNPWISVEDELPEDNQDILMADETGKRFSGRGRVLKATNGYEDTPTARHTKYTHWMPMPQAPKEQSK